MSTLTPEELAKQSTERTNFSFIDRLRGRNYAKDEVDVFLDEDLGYKLTRLREAFNSDETPVGLKPEIEKQINSVLDALEESRYTFFVEGISNERYDELIDEAAETFPYEYETITDPWSGKNHKEKIAVEGRDILFTNLLWAECIKKVEHGTEVDDNINSEFISVFRERAPLAAIKKVAETVDKVRMATEWIDYIEDEDFFRKP